MPRNMKLRNKLIQQENAHRALRYDRSWFRRKPSGRVIIGTSGGRGAKLLRGRRKRVFGSNALMKG